MNAVELPGLKVDAYRELAGVEAIQRLRAAAEPLRGLRVLHVNSTPDGGGVAEMLQSTVPLLRDLGIACDWKTIAGPPRFFEITKAIHNALQGHNGGVDRSDERVWEEVQAANAAELDDRYDVVMVHDPQPLGLAAYASSSRACWIWRLHIDSSDADHDVWGFLRPYLGPYAALVFTMPQFVPADAPRERVRIMSPAIDPLLTKNRLMSEGDARRVVASLGIDLGRSLIAQVSRLDRWKDPIGVIDTFRMVRTKHPGLQLALLGAMDADDDPEAGRVAAEVTAHAEADPDIHIYTDPAVIGQTEVGAVQRHADVVLQKSLREGFGLTVAEALWKGTPVVAGRVGGLPLQVQDGKTGFLVDSVEEAADRTGWLLSNPKKARAMGAAGHEAVRAGFLITRMLAQELDLYRDVLAGSVRETSTAGEGADRSGASLGTPASVSGRH